MTFFPNPPLHPRHNLRRYPAAPAVLALLLSVLAGSARAQGIAAMPTVFGSGGTVDSIVSKVNGAVLDVFDGALQIDVTNAKISGGDDRLANPLPASNILAGSRIVAQVTVPDAIPAVFPPRLSATSVVVFLAKTGSLSGAVQGVSASTGTFTVLFTGVKTTPTTEWSGTKGDGTPVKGIVDLSAGMLATAMVTADTDGVTATHVFAYAPPTTRLVAFRGKVVKIDTVLWTIDEHVVQVNADTKITGSPAVGDLVDVLERVPVLPIGVGAATIPVAISITKVVATPPPTSRYVEFDGVVESMPAGPMEMGHWTISGKDVLVNGLTKVDSGITKGTTVHVKGVPLPTAIFAPTPNPPLLATEITKK